MKKKPKTTICTCKCLCVDAMLACRLCLIHIKYVLIIGKTLITCIFGQRSQRTIIDFLSSSEMSSSLAKGYDPLSLIFTLGIVRRIFEVTR